MKKFTLKNLLNQYSVQYLFDIFNKNQKEMCLVGGCVRDALLNKKTNDIDFATNFLPQEIINILKENKIIYEDYAYKYGSIIAIINRKKFQITSLREDINQTGRHTNIIYTNDWKKDSQRRDFTINSIYLSQDGKLYDYFDGQKDLVNNKVKFIGNIDSKIKEDYLRIFRYYRFLGIFENLNILEEYERTIKKYLSKSFNYLSNELIRREILKMFINSFPLNSFFDNNKIKEKKYWVKLTKKHFIKTQYDLGLNKCLNKINYL